MSPPVLLAAFAVLMLVVAALMIRRSTRPPTTAGPQAGNGVSDGAGDGVAAGAGDGVGNVAGDSARAGDGAGDRAHRSMVRLRPFACDCRRVAEVLATVTAVGLLTGFFGVGGGFALVPALVLVLGFSMPVAVGTSLLVIAVNSATALAARAQVAAELDWVLIATFTAAAIVGSLLGSRAVTRVSPRRLSQVFAGLLILVALYTGVQSVTALL